MLESYPGCEYIVQGIEDLKLGTDFIAALLVAIGAPRLRRVGLDVPDNTPPFPEHRLYELLRADMETVPTPATMRCWGLVSFDRAVECGTDAERIHRFMRAWARKRGPPPGTASPAEPPPCCSAGGRPPSTSTCACIPKATIVTGRSRPSRIRWRSTSSGPRRRTSFRNPRAGRSAASSWLRKTGSPSFTTICIGKPWPRSNADTRRTWPTCVR